MKKRIAPLCAVLALLFSVVGCGAGGSVLNNATADYSAAAEAPQMAGGADYGGDMAERGMIDEEYDVAEDAEEAEPPEQAVGEQRERKIVYTVDLSLQTTGFDDATTAIPALVEEIGGFVQSSYVEGTNIHQKYYSRSASFTARVPAEKLDAFITSLGEQFHLVYEQRSSSDITSGYYDTEARLRSLRIQEERLTAMLESSAELEYLLEVQRELSEVLYQIDRITSELQQMDASVAMSTVTIHLQEVSSVEDTLPVTQPITFGERVREAFGDSWEGFIYFCQGVLLALIALLPYIPVLLVILAVILLVVRHRRKRRARAMAPATPPTVLPYARPDGDAKDTEPNDSDEPDQPTE